MKRIFIAFVLVVAGIELGCLAFDSLQASVNQDIAAFHAQTIGSAQ